MRAIQEGLGAGNPETCDARIGHFASSNESLGASHVEITGTSAYPPEPRRWVPHRKAEVVAAVRGGFLSLNEACRRYALSVEEYLSWEREIDLSGLPGLRVNRTQQRRRVRPRFTDHRGEQGPHCDVALQPAGDR